MKRILNLIAVLAVLMLSLTVVRGYASEPNPYGWDRSYQMSEVRGMWVKNHEGKYLGRVQDFVFDQDGRIVFAIVGYTKFNWKMIGEDSVAVPFRSLTYDRDAKHPVVMVDISLEKFHSAPKFTKAELTNRQQEAEVYRYFGQQPYWSEGRGSHSMEKNHGSLKAE